MHYPKISLVTPSYNQGQYIEQTILSVIEQGYPNLEYIIIDGGSTDNSVEIIKKYEKHLAYWVSEPDGGQSEAINKGLEKCTGEVFNWLNSDDYLEPGSLQIIGEAFAEPQTTVLCGRCRDFWEPSQKTKQIWQMPLKESTAECILTPYVNQPATFYRLPLLKETGALNTRLHYAMDQELWIRFLLAYGMGGVRRSEALLAHFRLHESSKSVAQSPKFREDVSLIYARLTQVLGLPEDISRALYEKPEKLSDVFPYSWPVKYAEKELKLYYLKRFAQQYYENFELRKTRQLLRQSLRLQGFWGKNISRSLVLKVFLVPDFLLSSIRRIKKA